MAKSQFQKEMENEFRGGGGGGGDGGEEEQETRRGVKRGKIRCPLLSFQLSGNMTSLNDSYS